jgi:hypothetical protein
VTNDDYQLICRHPSICRERAIALLFCKAEGMEMRLCGAHHREWQAEAGKDPGLSTRCPNCLPGYRARKESQAFSPRTTIADEPITGPLADAIAAAMLAEGVLSPTRERVLRRLGANTDAYVASVLAQSAGSLA